MFPTLSLIIPMHNEAPNVASCYERIRTILDPLGESWELLCVNDGSRDDTLARLLALREQDPRVTVIDLSRNFGKEAALTAGLDQARGDAVIPMDADLQDPPELIPELLARWREGFDVVLAVRSSRTSDSLFKRGTARFFYRFINRMSEVQIPEDAGDFRLMSRAVVDALKLLPERRRFMKGLFAWVGFRTTEVHYDRPPRAAGETKFNAWRLWNFALEGITSFSHLPLKVASYFGMAVSFFAFLYAIKIVIDTLVYGNPVKGYPSLMVAILFFSGVQLVAIGVIGEYLGRLYEESKQRPVYLIRKRYGPPVDTP
ncbi:MAG: glycosyltransferase family 2 protein [Betaproteobacteria bacterium]|nr:glycosyltransferase family 2 protein [Betaproteobacteria bacterium]MDE1982739.1 glycosyltransferase family 2 protein [Betaproteobacteria bacterium]MDE2132292.1 glycosyltransferase family 2 protein [Betaproteobacteria bacterium]MDE2211282.1 glycosyltransferase family 2 protein [Betaproteobacteria bacterium]MDE2623955.1 glycosyltransferase family 2 protein [Betaproteobacteria bacterium]